MRDSSSSRSMLDEDPGNDDARRPPWLLGEDNSAGELVSLPLSVIHARQKVIKNVRPTS